MQNLTETGEPAIQGVSTSQTHVYLLPEAFNPRNGTFLPDDPQPEGVGEDSNLYVTHLDSNGEPVLELAAKDLNGKVWGGNCGARLGGMESRLGSNVNLPNGERNQGAISADGFRTYISTRPGQPATGDCTEANRKRIMVREETPGGPAIEELFTGSECTRVSPSCSTSDGDDAYQGASIDQSKVYFTTTRQLADSDLDGSGAPSCDIAAAIAGCDLYLYDADRPSGNRLVQVSAGDNTSPTPGAGANLYNSIAAIAADGSRVYFVAQGKLTIDQNPEGATATAGQPNFYTWDAETEETHFIGSLAANDGGDFFESGLWGSHGTWNNGAYPVPIEGPDPAVGGDGHILLFKSNAALTAEDTDGTLRDLYRYDATTDQLILVSKPEPGGSDGGSINAVFGSNNAQPGTDYAQIGRPISEDGQTIEVITTGGLVPADTNSAEDIYLWREGSVFRVPGSDQTLKKANQPLVSADGSTIAFHTAAQLLPSDGDTALDVYAMRAGGGYPLTSPDRPPPTCFSDVNLCPSLVEGSISSERDINPPSKVASKKPCAKGKVRRQGKCVKKPKKASKRRRHNGRSAGAKQGDNK
ncbi:MAG TPA: hypothetical protein VI039_02160 [Solirubrobacterales bacterium]